MTEDNVKMTQVPKDELLRVREVLGRFSAPKTDAQVFYNLCFALCSPQTEFEQNKPVIEELERLRFFKDSLPDWVLRETLEPVKFSNVKADRLLKARGQFDYVLTVVRMKATPHEKRRILRKSIDGLGMKTASHFLRNQGVQELAVIDTHILKYLGEDPRKSVGDAKYLRLEEAFSEIADGMGLTVAELDTYLWKVCSGTSWEDYIF